MPCSAKQQRKKNRPPRSDGKQKRKKIVRAPNVTKQILQPIALQRLMETLSIHHAIDIA